MSIDTSKRRLVPLDSVQPDNEVMILPNFTALVEGREVFVTAVLERTAVVEPAPGEPKVLLNRHKLLVDPKRLRYGPIAARMAARRGREAARRNRLQQQQDTAA